MLEYSKIVLKTYNGEHEGKKDFIWVVERLCIWGASRPYGTVIKSMFSDVSFERLDRFVEDIVKLRLCWNILK